MKRVLAILKGLVVSAFVFYATSPLPLLAAKASEAEGPKASPWVFSYMAFVLCIFLGLAVIGIPTKREDKPKFND